MNNKMELGMRIARHCILREINNGCQKNFVMSPSLVHIALNMVASASTGRTLEQFLRVLKSESITELNDQSSFLMELATSGGEETIISFANGIWVDHRFPVKPLFKQLAEDVYKAKAESVDFVNKEERVRDEINTWAREVSKGHIDPLLPRGFFTEDSIALLASAIYFNGTWVRRFQPRDTKYENFYLLNGETVRVPFMKICSDRHLYGSFEGFKLLKMEYRNGQFDSKKYAMYIFLPDRKDGLQELVAKFCADPEFLLEKREVREVGLDILCVPKLKYEFELNTKETMIEMGLNLPFDKEEAEITEMVENTRDVVYLSKAIQKSYIEVNEQGTIATAFFSHVCGGGFEPVPSFVADHPFLFMIREEVSDIILFVGAALNPML